jgi:predicted kinase
MFCLEFSIVIIYMTTRRSTRGNPIETPIETPIEIPPELSDAPIKRPRKSKPFTIPASVPGSEYVSDPNLPACETDAEGLKGQTFLNFVYNQLKKGNNEGANLPTVYIMMGPPGAGKSTIKKTFNINNYVNIDLDEIKKICLRCFPDSSSLRGFGIIGTLKRFAKQLTDMAIAENMNILFDTTGRMKDVVENVINETKTANYQQIFIIVYTSLDNCLERASMRNVIETDREPMTSSMISGAYDSFMDKSASAGTASYYLISNPALTQDANQLYIFDNNGSNPQLLFKRVGGVVETVIDTPNFYNMSINSSEPYFTVNRKGGRRTRRKRRKQRGHKKSRRY